MNIEETATGTQRTNRDTDDDDLVDGIDPTWLSRFATDSPGRIQVLVLDPPRLPE